MNGWTRASLVLAVLCSAFVIGGVELTVMAIRGGMREPLPTWLAAYIFAAIQTLIFASLCAIVGELKKGETK